MNEKLNKKLANWSINLFEWFFCAGVAGAIDLFVKTPTKVKRLLQNTFFGVPADLADQRRN